MGLTADVTLRSLSLGARDATTGWKACAWDPSTIKMPVLRRGSSQLQLVPGVYVREDAVGLTVDAVNEGDQILDALGNYFEVVAIQEHSLLDTLYFFECQLHELPFWQMSPGSATWKTSPNDPRERTKTWIDTYADVDHSWITKDDGVEPASWACIFENPPYPMAREFRATASAINGLYVVGEQDSTPFLDSDQVPYGYKELVPIYINTVDSTDVTGTALHWKMKAELRYIAETYPTGSLRTVGRENPQPVHLGSMIMYQSQHILEYQRGTT